MSAASMSKTDERFGTRDAGLAQIMVGPTDDLSGMAFLVSPWLAVTCGHVVNVALGRPIDDISPIEESARVTVRFPFAHDVKVGQAPPQAPELQATVLKFRGPGRLPEDDIALLELSAPAPVEVGETVLAEIADGAVDRDQLDVFGIPEGTAMAGHFEARLAGRVNASWTQIDPVPPSGSFITGGFSGGRVWSQAHGATIGMVVAIVEGGKERRAFFIPASAIRRFLPGIPSERRRAGPNFCSIWTMFATSFLAIVLSHFLGERFGNYSGPLTLGAGNPVLNGFFGMHVNMVLMPIAFGMLLRFSSGYCEHPYWMRLPAFGRFQPPALTTTTRLATFLTLGLFVLVPLYLQAHFLKGFHSRGFVYIYPSSFGLNAADLERDGNTCFKPSVHYCHHPQATRYSTVTLREGTSAGYFDNAYQFGDRSLSERGGSVTFFPIAQPLLIWALSIVSLILAGCVFLRVFRRPARRR